MNNIDGIKAGGREGETLQSLAEAEVDTQGGRENRRAQLLAGRGGGFSDGKFRAAEGWDRLELWLRR